MVDFARPRRPIVPTRIKEIHRLSIAYHAQLAELTREAGEILGDNGTAEDIVLSGVPPKEAIKTNYQPRQTG